MNRQDLLETARALPAFSAAAAQEYADQRELLVASLNQIMLQRVDLDQLVGAGNHAMMQDNHRNHARFMGSLFMLLSPAVLVDTVLWVFRAYRSHGFQLTYWPAQLDTWVEIFREDLTEKTFEEIYPFYHWMIVHQPAFVELSDNFVPTDTTVTGH